MHHLRDLAVHNTAFVTPGMEHWLQRETVQRVRHKTYLAISRRFTTRLRLVPRKRGRYRQGRI